MFMRKILVSISFLLNFILSFIFLWNYFNSPSYKYGRLEKDIKVFNSSGEIEYKIPKGITVRDVSPRGLAAIGTIQNQRFEIILTSSSDEYVNYNLSSDSLDYFGNLFSISSKNIDNK